MTRLTDEELKADSDRMVRAGVFLPCVVPGCGYGMIVAAGRIESEPGVVARSEFFAECVKGGKAHLVSGFTDLAELKAWRAPGAPATLQIRSDSPRRPTTPNDRLNFIARPSSASRSPPRPRSWPHSVLGPLRVDGGGDLGAASCRPATEYCRQRRGCRRSAPIRDCQRVTLRSVVEEALVEYMGRREDA